jgi:hypothetical protein
MVSGKNEESNCVVCSIDPSEKNPLVLQINSENISTYAEYFPGISTGRVCKRCHAKYRYNYKRSCSLSELSCCICSIKHPEGDFKRRFRIYVQALKAIEEYFKVQNLKPGMDVCNGCWNEFSSKMKVFKIISLFKYFGNDPMNNSNDAEMTEKKMEKV